MQISELLRNRVIVEKPPSHPLAASVNEIKKVIGFKDDDKKYGYKYWLALVKRSGKAYPEILGILKDIERMDAKYPKGAVLTNKLKRK